VLDISPVTNTVTVGPREALEITEILGERPVWTGTPAPSEPLECSVQLRAHGSAHRCTAEVVDGSVRIVLHEPARGIAKGQAAVLYDGDVVLGSSTIAATSLALLAAATATDAEA
jgi:tRNA-specific 2-thiouridylase